MRKRLNLNGITEIRKIPSNCSDCGKLMYGGVCNYEIESNYLSCDNCFENSNGPEEGKYMVIEEYDRDIEFKFFVNESLMSNYGNKSN